MASATYDLDQAVEDELEWLESLELQAHAPPDEPPHEAASLPSVIANDEGAFFSSAPLSLQRSSVQHLA